MGHFFYFNYMIVSNLIMLTRGKVRPSVSLELNVGYITRQNVAFGVALSFPVLFSLRKEKQTSYGLKRVNVQVWSWSKPPS